jgi:hypothetical protein
MREPLSAGYVGGAALAVAGVSAYSLAKALRSAAAHTRVRLGLAIALLLFLAAVASAPAPAAAAPHEGALVRGAPPPPPPLAASTAAVAKGSGAKQMKHLHKSSKQERLLK